MVVIGAKNIDIICPNKLVTFFDSTPLLVYCLSQNAYKIGRNCVRWETIAYLMKCPVPVQQKKKKQILDALDNLCDLGFIKKENYWGYIIDANSFYNQTEGFERCSYEALMTLRDNAPLFQHYMLIKKGLINGKCTYDINYFTKMENVSERTIARRNQELVNLKLIDIYRKVKDDKYDRNVYVLHNDKYVTGQKFSNLDRSVSQRYNSFVKNPDKFTPLTRKTLRKQVEEYNQRNPDRAKDLTVFDAEIN